jgi:activator of HSP90 ATPase
MTGSLHLQTIIPNASAKQIYEAWMDSKKHSAFTGDTADIQPEVGGVFSIAGGYISGKTLELEPNRRILQAWRTTEFPEDAPDSKLEIILEDTPGGCSLILDQIDLPEDQVDSYKSGWVEYYFHPLVRYFSGK